MARESDVDGDDDPRLEWLAEPVEVLRYDPVDGDATAVRLFYDLVGNCPRGTSLSEVRVVESGDCVAVTLIRRDLVGTGPDGAEHGYKLFNCLSCIEVNLRWPLDECRVIDGSTGRTVSRLDRAPRFDPERGSLDEKFGELARTGGCPRWR